MKTVWKYAVPNKVEATFTVPKNSVVLGGLEIDGGNRFMHFLVDTEEKEEVKVQVYSCPTGRRLPDLNGEYVHLASGPLYPLSNLGGKTIHHFCVIG